MLTHMNTQQGTVELLLLQSKIPPSHYVESFSPFFLPPQTWLTVYDITRLIIPSLSSPCLPLRLYHSSSTFPCFRDSGIVMCVQAMRSSIEKARWNTI